MLDQETKRKIDSARQILVGKVPDPKQQVDQITNALIYKFMDDMDKEAQELGGKAKFFTGDFEKYSWTKLLDRRLSGQERLDLYVRAVSNMFKNSHIPQLFRNIFKDAFLPYRDPETLSLFLKEINEFSYDHSEDLGNAFEYLLSILGSQGDAGQFRTPRHIIDFIVEVVDPKKDQTILDPACGTAGFLISAYKHILHDHDALDNKTGKPTNKEKNLTPDERKKLMNNFVGYDISPDMVKLSLVNMYLHGFQEPKIYEYDTLTSEKNWGEQFDVIMANPPFMSPKGGIRPHKRFSVQANRSEVLFVDYILEHLNLKGRAGIIVPEGIIFKIENAYKQLRQMLIEDGLFAVVSLPAGVFHPYAGVKTSILFFDNQVAKKTSEILFVKVENDGFDLGAQRRPIKRNNLPEALKIIREFQKNSKRDVNNICKILKIPKPQKLGEMKWGEDVWSTIPLFDIVSKKKIAKDGDYNLTGERYREVEILKNQKWEMVELGEIAEINAGNSAPQDKKLFEHGKYPFCRTSDVGKVHISKNFKNVNDYLNQDGIKGLKLFKKDTILFPKSGASTFLNHRAMLAIESYVSNHLATIFSNRNKILPDFLFYLLKQVDAKDLTNNQDYPSLKLSDIKKIKISLPPLKVQKEIVEQIKVKQNAINYAKEVIKNLERERRYFGQELRKLEGIKWVELGEVAKFTQGQQVDKGLHLTEKKDGYSRFIRIIDYTQDNFDIRYIPTPTNKEVFCNNKDLIMVRYGRPGLVGSGIRGVFANNLFKIDFLKNDKIDLNFMYYFLNSDIVQNYIKQHLQVSGLPAINHKITKKIKIPLPPFEIQKKLVIEVEKEQEVINVNKQLIEIMEQKITNILNKI